MNRTALFQSAQFETGFVHHNRVIPWPGLPHKRPQARTRLRTAVTGQPDRLSGEHHLVEVNDAFADFDP